MAKTRPVLTPAQIEAGVQKNATEYENRVTALRALHDSKAYNPEMSSEALSKAALEAGRAATGKPAMALHGPGNEGDVRAAGRDAEAEALAKASGGRRNGRKAKVEEGESGEGVEGDAGVPAREAAFGQQARPASPFAQAGNSHSLVAVWTEQVYEAESEEAVRALVPAGAKAVEVFQIWKATALVKA
jgi:hypothetical protein